MQLINFYKYANSASKFDWRNEADKLINYYEGDNKNKLYTDVNGKLTFPGGLAATPEFKNLARKFGYKGAFSNNQMIDPSIWNKLRNVYTTRMYNALDKNNSFKNLDPRVKARLADLQYNANVIGRWPNLTKAVNSSDYEGIMHELEDSKVFRNEVLKRKENPNARTRFGDHYNYIKQLKLVK